MGTRPRTKRGEAQRYFREVVLAYEGDECLAWPFARFRDGYGEIQIDGKPKGVHRHVCEEAHGPAPTPEHQAAHSCGRGKFGCVTKRHLSWKTNLENKADELIHGTRSQGERHGMAKLTAPQVRKILALKGILTQQKIGARFGVSHTTVGRLFRRENWASLS